jgi:magnesium transporter
VVRSIGPQQLLWVDLERQGEKDERLADVAEVLELADADIARIGGEVGRARLTRTQDRLHLTLQAMQPDEADPTKLVRREIDLVAGRNVVLSVHDGPVGALQRFEDGLEGETRLGLLDAADLLSSFVDEVVTGYYQVVEVLDREIDGLDERALGGKERDEVLGGIVSLRHRIAVVRRTLAPHRDVVATFGRPEMRVDESFGEPWPGLVDRVEGAIAAIEGLRESLIGTYDIHMGRMSQRANDVMRTLTLLSAVLLPAVVLAGVMGMNFEVPFFDEVGNFFVVVGAMGVLAVLILGIARWRDWI